MVGWIHRLLRQQHLDAGQDQEATEHINNPGKGLDQRHTAEDKSGTQDQGADDAIKKNLVLMDRCHGESREDQQEDEKVVDRQRLLDQESGQKLFGAQPSIVRHSSANRQLSAGHCLPHLCIGEEPPGRKPDESIEDERQCDPHATPRQRFAHAHHM